MKNKFWHILFGHVLFWTTCVSIQLCLSEKKWFIDLGSVLIYAFPFYINYFIVLPIMPKKKHGKAVLLSFSLYIILSMSQIYPLYLLFEKFFVPMEIVGKGHKIGAILHLSFFFFAISSLSRILVDKIIKKQKRYFNSLKKIEGDILKIRNEMSFNFTSNVLGKLYENALDEPKSVASSIGYLSRVLRYKLHKTNSENTLLSDEIKIIQQYIHLVNITQQKKWDILFREEAWIPIGSALKKVENHIQNTNQRGGTLLIEADDFSIWLSSK
ncbi:MAG: hypothetical protein CMP67_07945 [Flavobacteriales bacterium]|nr:hypothetical protein [Flavobacteriales bacterium]|tara:strand:- start:88 stop:897 length:810 start_codon:yes stop_codon:yes gene_type:complete